MSRAASGNSHIHPMPVTKSVVSVMRRTCLRVPLSACGRSSEARLPREACGTGSPGINVSTAFVGVRCAEIRRQDVIYFNPSRERLGRLSLICGAPRAINNDNH